MTERVLSQRELGRATLARQLLLERKRLSTTAVIERLVGMQAQWPSAPYVGIWTRTTSFRRGTLERELAKGSVLKANLMRQTLHLVTRRDYGLLRAAISESGHPDQWPNSIKVAPSVRALAEWFGERLGKGVQFTGNERADALLSNTSRMCETFAAPEVSLDQMREWVAQWIEEGGPLLGKATKFEARDGRF